MCLSQWGLCTNAISIVFIQEILVGGEESTIGDMAPQFTSCVTLVQELYLSLFQYSSL